MSDVIMVVIDCLDGELHQCGSIRAKRQDLKEGCRGGARALLRVLRKVPLESEHVEKLRQLYVRQDDGVSDEIHELLK